MTAEREAARRRTPQLREVGLVRPVHRGAPDRQPSGGAASKNRIHGPGGRIGPSAPLARHSGDRSDEGAAAALAALLRANNTLEEIDLKCDLKEAGA